MYGKLFSSMYDGTLYGQWEALITFQQMIILADADGTVDITPPALAARTGIPLDIITKGIETLESPDPYSRTEGEDGRRITRIDEHRPWGWSIVNHAKYKHLQDSDTVREQTRERVRKHREKKRIVTGGNVEKRTVTDGNGSKRHTDTDTDTDTREKGQNGKRFVPPTLQEVSDYCQQRNSGVNPHKWFDHYKSNGWKVGRNPMKDWKAAVRKWEDEPAKPNGSDYGKGAI